MPTWPPGVPSLCRLEGMNLTPFSGAMPVDVEAGEPMTRRRFTGEMARLQGTLSMTRKQAIDLYNFWRYDLKQGSLRFTEDEPMTQAAGEFLFLEPPGFSRVSHRYQVTISVQRIG